ncbi:hypothetical protein CMK18_14655 [Candidatus Poribacteria bacterium]|nr:hypothetical protein [Candidatus Poribacteria bacterium]
MKNTPDVPTKDYYTTPRRSFYQKSTPLARRIYPESNIRINHRNPKPTGFLTIDRIIFDFNSEY